MTKEADVAGVTTTLYSLLKPLESDDRQRVVGAVMTLLGEFSPLASSASKKGNDATSADGEEAQLGYPPKVRVWLQKNSLTNEALSQVFHIEGGAAEIISGDIPGKTSKDKTLNAYVLTGIREYLLHGDAKFDDKSAREVCKSLGCYNDTNHSTYIKDRGNVIGGSKGAGWTLTGPGLKAAADLIKELAG